MPIRTEFQLTSQELAAFAKIRPIPGEAWDFWEKVALGRGMDFRTILYTDGHYSALPLGHRKPWCDPLPLKCRHRAQSVTLEGAQK